MSATSDLPFLLRLLDDKDPAVRPVVREQFEKYQGDLSHDLAALGISVSESGQKCLSHWLAPGRRERLWDEWIVPTGGGVALADDWDSFENLLRLLGDFLHDGVSLRPALPDYLDLLTDEIRGHYSDPTPDDLRRWLFKKNFLGVSLKADAMARFDLGYVIDRREGNATSLGCLFMLVGRRLGIRVDGCNYPGHFLCRIEAESDPCLVDCFHDGRKFDIHGLLSSNSKMSIDAQRAIVIPCYLGDVLLRYLKEMHQTLSELGRGEDALLLEKLAATLTP